MTIIKSDKGAITAEYAIATMAAVAFAGLLVIVLRSDEVRQMLRFTRSTLNLDYYAAPQIPYFLHISSYESCFAQSL